MEEREVRLPKLFQDGCVLQQGEHTKIWGFCRPEERIQVWIQGKRKETVSDDRGRFELELPTLEPGGPYELEVKGEREEEIQISHVFVGEVLVCAGQSNMELPMRRVAVRYPEEFQAGGCEQVHIYKVMEHPEFQEPLEEHEEAYWYSCSKENLEEASAVSYFLGKFLYEKYEVPIGILNLSLGGTPAEAWISREGLANYPEYRNIRTRYQSAELRENIVNTYNRNMQDWLLQLEQQEREMQPKRRGMIQVPGWLEDQGLPDFCGVIWLRRKFEMPENAREEQGILRFGTLADSDRIYLNGKQIGETGYRYPPRRYPIEKGLLKEGENEIAIRLVCQEGDGRITPGKDHDIVTKSGTEISLEGQWEYEIRGTAEPAPIQEFLNRKPSCLFQGMAAPCIPYTVKGVVWYQGESNDRDPESYEGLLKTLILDWRRHWKQEHLPFVILQLPNCGIDIAPGDAWPLIRQAQSRAAQLPEVAVTVNIDLGEDNDLHPLNKKDVAYRAFLALEKLVYKEDVTAQGPTLTHMNMKKKQLVLTFCTGDGEALETMEGHAPQGFEVRTEKDDFREAAAKLEGNRIILDCSGLGRPVQVRYAWSCTPGGNLLCNHTGLPAEPFCKDVI